MNRQVKLADMLAFPSHGTMGEVVQSGMTLRHYYAAKAPTSEVVAIQRDGVGWRGLKHGKVNCSFWEARLLWADALIAELERQS